MIERVSVVGLGKLGACIAACIAGKGMEAIGVDSNATTVRLVNEGAAPVVEPGLAQMIKANRARLRATDNYDEAILNTDMTMIVVPTPSDQNGRFTLDYVLSAAQSVSAAIAKKNGFHVVCITSTVLPGSTQAAIVPLLEKVSGKRCGKGFGVCYNPEFIALGDVLRGLLEPDFILIGESDPKTGAMLEEWYGRFCNNHPPVHRMNFVNAELTKISVNTFVTTKITFANMLAAICEELPGGDIDVVTRALGADARIGPRYLKGALGYGGPCFPRDNKALAYIAKELGCQAALAETTDESNRALLDRQLSRIRALIPHDKTIGVLGLAYKPDTNVVEESQGLVIARRLVEHGRRVVVYDPFAMENARRILNGSVEYATSLRECIRKSDAVVIANPCREFAAISAADLPDREEPLTVIDCWRLLRGQLSSSLAIRYHAIGAAGEHQQLLDRVLRIWRPSL
jgi:UDPglucose 6-dehydrogenase